MAFYKTLLVGVLASLSAVAGACSSSGMSGGDDDGSGSGTGTGTGTGGSNWTAMTLPDGHDQDDSVTGIYYTSPTQGLVVSSAGESASTGAVFNANATTVTGTAFDTMGNTSAGGELGGLDFFGVIDTPIGVMVMTASSDLVVADSSGKVTDVANGSLALNPMLAVRVTSSSTTIVTPEVVYSAPSAPGPSASYVSIFAPPPASPTTPEEFPDGDCQEGPTDPQPTNQSAAAISSNGTTMIYSAGNLSDNVPEVCVSTDGGMNFTPTELNVQTEGAVAPSGVLFPSPSDPTTIIAYYASLDADPGEDYIMRSTDTGKTFTAVTIPSSLSSHSLEFDYAFFAPDGQHGWIIGLDATNDASPSSFALVTTDGGKTWAADATGLAQAAGSKLRAGFALDATHVWVGGDDSTLLAYTPQ